jgi:hypothetical protein
LLRSGCRTQGTHSRGRVCVRLSSAGSSTPACQEAHRRAWIRAGAPATRGARRHVAVRLQGAGARAVQHSVD